MVERNLNLWIRFVLHSSLSARLTDRNLQRSSPLPKEKESNQSINVMPPFGCIQCSLEFSSILDLGEHCSAKGHSLGCKPCGIRFTTIKGARLERVGWDTYLDIFKHLTLVLSSIFVIRKPIGLLILRQEVAVQEKPAKGVDPTSLPNTWFVPSLFLIGVPLIFNAALRGRGRRKKEFRLFILRKGIQVSICHSDAHRSRKPQNYPTPGYNGGSQARDRSNDLSGPSANGAHRGTSHRYYL